VEKRTVLLESESYRISERTCKQNRLSFFIFRY
jgi:hypothetical protein